MRENGSAAPTVQACSKKFKVKLPYAIAPSAKFLIRLLCMGQRQFTEQGSNVRSARDVPDELSLFCS